MKELRNLKEAILKNYPRLTQDHQFQFSCHPAVPCFTECCADVNIFLTPYDILRLKNKLGISSSEFLNKYTILPIDSSQKLPIVQLKMQADESKQCYFLESGGCSVYEDRPWSCRMYPIGLAAPDESLPEETQFYFLLEEECCQGFKEQKRWTIKEWLENQKVAIFNEFGELYKQITFHPKLSDSRTLSPEKIEMFYKAIFDLDEFRRFLFESSFFEKFEIEEEKERELKSDDEELLRFGFTWLRFCLFGEPILKIKDAVLNAKKKVIDI